MAFFDTTTGICAGKPFGGSHFRKLLWKQVMGNLGFIVQYYLQLSIFNTRLVGTNLPLKEINEK